MSDDLDHLLNLIDTHKRRLQIRELQAATFGNEMNEEALRILEDIESIKKNIIVLQNEYITLFIADIRADLRRVKWLKEDIRRLTLMNAANMRRSTIWFKKLAENILGLNDSAIPIRNRIEALYSGPLPDRLRNQIEALDTEQLPDSDLLKETLTEVIEWAQRRARQQYDKERREDLSTNKQLAATHKKIIADEEDINRRLRRFLEAIQ